MGRKSKKLKIVIPESVIKCLPTFSKYAKLIFKSECIRKPPFHLVWVATVKLGRREIPIYAAERQSRSKLGGLTLASYYRNTDYIVIYRTAIKRVRPSKRTLVIQRILAHEIAHAVDQKRLIRLGNRSPQDKGSKKSRAAYVCHSTEYDAEMASIVQVAVPYILKQRNGAQVLIDFFTNNKRLWPLHKYKPFWPILANGYIIDWCNNERLCKRFFRDLARAFWQSAYLIKDRKRLETCVCPIIKMCLKMIKKCSPISGVDRSSERSSRARRSSVSSRKSGSETGVSLSLIHI